MPSDRSYPKLSRRWRAVRLGLQLAARPYAGIAFVLVYGIWFVLGLVLSIVFLVLMFVGGSSDSFKGAIEPVALYGFTLPLAGIGLIGWLVQLLVRLLWCGTPEAATTLRLAVASCAGRLAIPVASAYVVSAAVVNGSCASCGKSLAEHSVPILSVVQHNVAAPTMVLALLAAVAGLAADWWLFRALHEKVRSAFGAAERFTKELEVPASRAASQRGFSGRWSTWLLVLAGVLVVGIPARDGGDLMARYTGFALCLTIVAQAFWTRMRIAEGALQTLAPEESQVERPTDSA